MIRVIACGKAREKWMMEGIREYTKRISGYDKIELTEVSDEKAPESNSAAENEAVKKLEGERLLKSIKPQEYVILLDLAGEPCDSVGLSEKIQDLQLHGHSRIDFVIGGSLGLSRELIQRQTSAGNSQTIPSRTSCAGSWYWNRYTGRSESCTTNRITSNQTGLFLAER